jgi:hypothetical protein
MRTPLASLPVNRSGVGLAVLVVVALLVGVRDAVGSVWLTAFTLAGSELGKG